MTITIRATYVEVASLAAPVLDLQAASDLGDSSTDNITSATSLGFDVYAPEASEADEITWRLYKSGVLAETVVETGTPVTFSSVSGTSGTDDWTATYQITAGGLSLESDPETVTVDTTLPVLSSPTGVTGSDTTANVGVTTDTAQGAIRYVVCLSSATAPNKTQIWAYTDGADNPISNHGELAITTTGVKSWTLTSLIASTSYVVYWTQRDVAGNLATAVSASFTTDVSSVVAVTADSYYSEVRPNAAPNVYEYNNKTFTTGIAIVATQFNAAAGGHTVTINGVGMTQITDGSYAGLFYLAVTAGTYHIVVTATGGTNYCAMAKCVIHNASSTAGTFTIVGGTVSPQPFSPGNIPAYGIGIAFGSNYGTIGSSNDNPATDWSWTGCEGSASDAANVYGSGYTPIIAMNHKNGGPTGITAWSPTLVGVVADGYQWGWEVLWAPA